MQRDTEGVMTMLHFDAKRRVCNAAAVMSLLGSLSVPVTIAQDKATTAKDAPLRDTSFIDADGTAHVTRVIPVPGTISIEAQKMLARVVSDAPEPDDIAAQRKSLSDGQGACG